MKTNRRAGIIALMVISIFSIGSSILGYLNCTAPIWQLVALFFVGWISLIYALVLSNKGKNDGDQNE